MSEAFPINPPGLFIGGVTIRQDEHGRYRLNDLHKASGASKSKSPNDWLRNQQTIEFLEEVSKPEISGLENNQAVVVIHGGSGQGTYGIKKLALAYATWISPRFFSHVLDVYDHAVTRQLAEANDKLQMLKTELKATVPANKYLAVIDQRDEAKEKYQALLESRSPAFGVPRLWTEVEDIQAMDGWLSGLGFTRIGFPLGRTKDSVRHRFKAKLFTRFPEFVAQHYEVYRHLPRAQAVLSGGAA